MNLELEEMSQEMHELIANVLEAISFKCGCGKSTLSLHTLDFDDIISYLRNKEPIYHMGMLGCCEDLRCYNCDDMPSVCECGNYDPWGDRNE
tara:strand:+ start:1355 stop:1630 length:276 start_codon:yes stop_codon:yes gene_type:complete